MELYDITIINIQEKDCSNIIWGYIRVGETTKQFFWEKLRNTIIIQLKLFTGYSAGSSEQYIDQGLAECGDRKILFYFHIYFC